MRAEPALQENRPSMHFNQRVLTWSILQYSYKDLFLVPDFSHFDFCALKISNIWNLFANSAFLRKYFWQIIVFLQLGNSNAWQTLKCFYSADFFQTKHAFDVAFSKLKQNCKYITAACNHSISKIKVERKWFNFYI